MKRSDFIKSASVLASVPFLGIRTAASAQPENSKGLPFNLDYAPHQGMFSATAGKNFLDEIQYYYDLGFRSIEDNGMPGRSVEEQKKIGQLLEKLGMRMGVFVVPKGGNGANSLAAGKQDYVDIFWMGVENQLRLLNA